MRPHSLYASARWLRLLEYGARAPSSHVTGSQVYGKPVGLLPIYETPPTANPRYDPEHLLRGLPADRRPVGACFAGPMSGYHWDIPTDEAVSIPDALTAMLTEVGDSALILPYLTSESAMALARLTSNADVLVEGVDGWLDVRHGCFSDYIDAVPSVLRHAIRRDLAEFRAAGLARACEPLAECADAFAPLAVQTSAKYHVMERAQDLAAYFRSMVDVFGEDAVVFTARRNGRLVGGTLAFLHEQTIWLRLVGFDYQRMPSAAYFMLYFHAPVELACRLSFDHVHLGLCTDRTKRSRGARLEPLWTLLTRASLPAAVVERGNAARVMELSGAVGKSQRASFLAKVETVIAAARRREGSA